MTESIAAMVEKVQSLLEPLKNISFDNLLAAFDRLKEAVAPLGETAFSGLRWAYDNVLVPFAQWVIEDAAPAFFDALAAAASVLSAVLAGLQPYASWIWNNFLQPLAAWTGGVVVGVLKGITETFSELSIYIRNNEGAVKNAIIAIVGAFGLWETIQFANYVKYIGQLTQTQGFDALKNAVIQAATQGFASFKQHILDSTVAIRSLALATADQIKNFVLLLVEMGKQAAAWVAQTAKLVAQTAAQWASNAATAAWNGLCAAGAAVTTAFGAAVAFLTSPVGLVVAAIAALIAIIVLLVKNWDDVKAFALGCWEAIKECWNAVAAWFDETVVQPLVGFFTGLWNSICNLAQWAWNGILGIWKSVSQWFDSKVIQPVKNLFTSLWEGIQKVFTSVWEVISGAFKGHINGWIGMIEGFANFFVRMLNYIIDALNSISIDIPDWGIFGDMAGGTFGFNIPRMSGVKLPRLATGAVIPANREFMAILGDQRHGTNIEAPADLIRQIVREETAGMRQTDDRPLVVVMEIDGDEMGRKMINFNNRQGYQVGGAFANAY